MVRLLKKYYRYLILLSILFVGCGSDLQTKKIAKEKLQKESIEVIDGVFDLTYVENHAIAFGIFSRLNHNIRIPFILILTGSIGLFGLFLVWKLRKYRLMLLVSLIFILAGAFGNIIDRLIHGFVTDLFHVYYRERFDFPVFNMADVMINIGIFTLLFQIRYFDNAVQTIFKKKSKTI